MIYAQVKSGHKLHLVYEAGEGRDDQHLVRDGYVSDPLCGLQAVRYRMTINVPLGKACRNCLRVYAARRAMTFVRNEA